MNVSDAIEKRESIRAYLDKPVPSEDIEKIVEAGRWAPNAGPFQISVIRNPELRKKINDRTFDAMVHSDNEFIRHRAALPGYQPLYGAPVLILLSGPQEAPFTALNSTLSAENMILQATELGLGSCFIVSPTHVLNSESNHDLATVIGLTDGYRVQCAIVLGYAAAENRFAVRDRVIKGTVNYVD